MTEVDPSVVGQHVRPLENNYFKACCEVKNFLYYEKIVLFLRYLGFFISKLPGNFQIRDNMMSIST